MSFESLEHIRRECDTRKHNLEKIDETLRERASDDATVRELAKKLTEAGTDDMERRVQLSVEQAGGTIQGEFKADHEEATREQAETEQLERQLEAVAESDARNAEALTAAGAEMHSEVARQELADAAEKSNNQSAEFHETKDDVAEYRAASLREAERLYRQVMRDHHG